MLLLSLIFLQVSSNIVEYRFSINFGQKFWDYSGNNNHGSNNLVASKIKSTDRGVYLMEQDSRIEAPYELNLPISVSYLSWVMPSDSQYRLLFRTRNNIYRYHLGRKSSTDSVYIHVTDNGVANNLDGPANSFPASVWSLVVLTYDGVTFRAFINQDQKVALTNSFTQSSTGFHTGVGTFFSTEFTVVNAFVWNYIITSETINYSKFMSSSGITCIVPGTCNLCSPAVIDDDGLGTGCLPTVMDPSKESYGNSCSSSSYGCSITTQYYCSTSTNTCGYDRVSNTCYQQMLSSPYTITNVSCTCNSGYISTNGQCCNSDCNTCDMTGKCLTCKSANTFISSGICYCMSGYYGVPPLITSTSCCSVGTGCSKCESSNPCTACIDPNAYISGNSCKCNNGYYASSSNTCSKCNSGCKLCSESDLCLECLDISMIENNEICTCKEGYYLSASTICTPCGSGCKSCIMENSCILCWDSMMIKNSGLCTCPEGYYLDSSYTCAACNIRCKTCSSTDLCLTCSDGSFYSVDLNICLPCNQGCKMCDEINLCDICWDISMMKTNDNICSCQDGFYFSSANICIACALGCKTCSEINSCLTCLDQNSLSDGKRCNCINGYYKISDTNCAPCEAGCKECISSIECTSCFDVLASPSGSSCVCLSGYYLLPSNLCSPCGQHCSNCSPSNLCISCFDTTAKIINFSCSCSEGFYMDHDSHLCHSCDAACTDCNNSECFQCISDNTEIVGQKCQCKSGYWSYNEPIHKNSCQTCFNECKSCISELKCLTCKSKNASPRDDLGCICNRGFWNSSQLVMKDSCKKCKPTCKTCTNFKECTSCQDPAAELNSEGDCVVLCWKNRTEDCVNCNSLCDKCDKNLNCLNCTENSSQKNGICSCIQGFQKHSSKCIEKFFYSNLTVITHHKLILTFNEYLIRKLKNSDLELIIDGQPFNFYLKNLNSSSYRIIVVGVVQVNETIEARLIINTRPVYSANNSMLFNYILFGKMRPNETNSFSELSYMKPFIQTVVTTSAGMAMMSNPAGLWGLINTIQLITYMPINAVPYSRRLRETSTAMIDYNIIPNVMSFISDSHATSVPDQEILDFGIETSVIVLNTDSIWLIFVQCVILSLISVILATIFKNSLKLQKYKQKYKFNTLIRFWIESYLELTIFGLIQARAVINIQEILSPVEGYFYLCMAVVVCFLAFFSPFALFVTMKNSAQSIQDDEFLMVYASLYDEFWKDRGVVTTLYYPLFLIRRLAYSIIQIFMNSYPAYQAYINVGCTVVVLFYFLYYKPFNENLVMISQSLGEFCVFIVFLVSSFCLYTDKHSHIKMIDQICIYSIIATIAIQFIINFVLFLRALKELWNKITKEKAIRFARTAHRKQLVLVLEDID